MNRILFLMRSSKSMIKLSKKLRKILLIFFSICLCQLECVE